MQNTKNPLVSIITPVLNSGKFLEKTIQSIISQDYGNIEHIIVDGGSSDNTIGILKQYEKRYNLLWVSEKDQGVAEAYDKGIKMAKGDFLGWCSSDDYYTKGAIKKIMKIFNDNPESDLVFGACQEFDYKTQKFSTIYRNFPIFKNVMLKDVLYGKKQIFLPSLFYRKRIIDKVGPINTNYRFGAIEGDWCERMAENEAKITYLDEILAIIGQHGARISIKFPAEGIQECMQFLKKNGKKIPLKMRISYFRWKYPLIPNLIKKWIQK